jgi:photosystem II stability/assembly factor-like uncharacterized protein
MSEPLWAGKGAIFAQRDGAPNALGYLGCHDLLAMTIPKGDVTRTWCPNPAATGTFKVSGSYQGEPGAPTFTINTVMGGAADYLEDWPCKGNVIWNKQLCGRRDDPSNWVRRFIGYQAYQTEESADKMIARDPKDEGETTQAFPFTPMEILKLFRVAAGTSGVAAALAQLNWIAIANSPRCAGECGAAMDACQVLWTGGDHITGSALDKADVYWSIDGGSTWTVAAALPFLVAMDTIAGVSFPIDNATTRVMVMNGTTQAGQGPEIAYTDDNGATWTKVEIIATHALYGLSPYSLYALDRFHIWAVTTAGGIAFSDDGGATWVTQGVGVTAAALWGVKFASALVGYAVGAAGVALKTTDGGVTWALMTLPAAYAAITLQALEVLSEQEVWFGAANGDLLYSPDGGVSWYVRKPAAATGIVSVAFSHPMVGWAFGTTALADNAGWRTTDGGATWDSISVPAALDTASQFLPCSLNSGVLLGGTVATGVFAKFMPV